jgi:tetratricopeptide (TPR) repeat protein
MDPRRRDKREHMRRCAELSQHCPEPLRLRGPPLFNDHDRDPKQQPGSFLTSRPGSILASVEDRLLPTFYWQAIAGTIVDLTVERAYDDCAKRLQHCVPFTRDGQRVESRLINDEDVMYLKLNGCITEAQTVGNPLVLAAEQHATHRQSRTRLFERLQEFALEFPIVAFGSSLSDPDLRTFLQLISSLPDARPTSYVVAADYSPADERLWSSRRFVAVKMTFDEFMDGLDRLAPRDRRRLAPLFTNDHPLLRRAAVPGRPTLSPELRQCLEHEVDYLYPEYRTKVSNPGEFYKGYLEDWSPIAQQLDVKRHLGEQILLDAFLPSETERIERQELFIVKGHAGSGKTVLLRRLTWDAAISFDKLCLYLKGPTVPDVEVIRQLHALTNQRIFLIIDEIAEHTNAVEKLLAVCGRKGLPITIVGGIRSNDWNTHREQLAPLSSQTYELEYLTDVELEQLVHLLTIHRSLGHLEGLDKKQQIAALAGHAGRQLLVALHEATLGRPFADIVADEYHSITTAPARSLYLTVCVLHSLGVAVRAGLISRVHRIPLSQFRSELFAPLDSVVHVRPSRAYKDYEYVTRHQHIAEMVVERVLLEGQARFDEYARIVSCLDIDYESDRDALHGLMNAKYLRRSFAQERLVQELYILAEKRFSESAAVFQQHGIFEMSPPTSAFDRADALLHHALQLAPRSRIISHSLAELARKRADHAASAQERARHRTEARRLLNATTEADPQGAAYSYHTKIKILLDELMELGREDHDISFQEKTKEIEKNIATGLGKFPDDSHLLEAESRFYGYLKERPRALTSLKAAYEQNRRSTYLALSLAKLYDERGESDNGSKVLREAVEGSPNDKELHFALARKLLATGGAAAEIQYHLHRSFIAGDARHAAQFTYARFLYERGEIQQASEIFARLRQADLPESMKRKSGHWITDGAKRRRFSGVVALVDASFGFVLRDQIQDKVFCRRTDSRRVDWTDLRPQARVTFEIGFNYLGPVATDLAPEAHAPAAAVPSAAAALGTAASPAAPPAVGGVATAPGSEALKLWREKLDVFLRAEALAHDPAEKFRLTKQIEEAREKIRELGG